MPRAVFRRLTPVDRDVSVPVALNSATPSPAVREALLFAPPERVEQPVQDPVTPYSALNDQDFVDAVCAFVSEVVTDELRPIKQGLSAAALKIEQADSLSKGHERRMAVIGNTVGDLSARVESLEVFHARLIGEAKHKLESVS